MRIIWGPQAQLYMSGPPDFAHCMPQGSTYLEDFAFVTHCEIAGTRQLQHFDAFPDGSYAPVGLAGLHNRVAVRPTWFISRCFPAHSTKQATAAADTDHRATVAHLVQRENRVRHLQGMHFPWTNGQRSQDDFRCCRRSRRQRQKGVVMHVVVRRPYGPNAQPFSFDRQFRHLLRCDVGFEDNVYVHKSFLCPFAATAATPKPGGYAAAKPVKNLEKQ